MEWDDMTAHSLQLTSTDQKHIGPNGGDTMTWLLAAQTAWPWPTAGDGYLESPAAIAACAVTITSYIESDVAAFVTMRLRDGVTLATILQTTLTLTPLTDSLMTITGTIALTAGQFLELVYLNGSSSDFIHVNRPGFSTDGLWSGGMLTAAARRTHIAWITP